MRNYLELIKPRLTLVALLPVALGYFMGRGVWSPFSLLVAVLAGSALLGAGANTLKQYLEKDTDAKMARTKNRPLPANRLLEKKALIFGFVLCASGLAILFFFVNVLSFFLAGLTALSYVFLYTPLKRSTYLNTYVGAVPGALPSVIGWAASGAPFGVRPWILFAILYAWQLPHFFAIAWVYREDYKNAGLKMLPVADDSGRLTSWKLVLLSLSLFILSLAPWAVGMTGTLYLSSALFLGTLLSVGAMLLVFRRLREARGYALGSIAYLILLVFFMILDKKT